MSHLMVLLHGQNVLGGVHAVSLKPLGIDIQGGASIDA